MELDIERGTLVFSCSGLYSFVWYTNLSHVLLAVSVYVLNFIVILRVGRRIEPPLRRREPRRTALAAYRTAASHLSHATSQEPAFFCLG